jgi:hypothetical protein
MARATVCRKRPCRVCRRWFMPNPRLKDRQMTCGEATGEKAACRRSMPSNQNTGLKNERKIGASWRSKIIPMRESLLFRITQ